jgi:acyl transferase domain-containing protein/thioesterase domain-containing protein
MSDDIAIIGQACRLPGAVDCGALWANLERGANHVRRFTDDELRASGVSSETLKDPTYVKCAGYLEGIEEFDAAFFGYTRREAELMDPQQRLFLQCAWSALERAGYRPDKVPGRVGVFAGAAPNRYLIYNLLPNAAVFPRDGADYQDQQLIAGSSSDYLTSRVSYKLGLTGPSMTVQTACSSSLTAVALACDSLVEYGCDLALAGGVSISALRVQGYHCPPGGLLSRSGVCRPFSAEADGSVFGSGLGIVVLRRLEDALANGDHVHCVIRGWAVNNDGDAKAGFSAPSVRGQADAARAALIMAGVDPTSIELMEAHGSGTPVGDPIEFEALSRVYVRRDRAYCALGSIKANVGHLDAAAGVAGLLKASLSLEHRRIPPAINFRTANPAIALDDSAFYVTTEARDWARGSEPRRAAVHSTGLGGTNVHLVLEEAPGPAEPLQEEPCNLLVVSARTEGALERACTHLGSHLKAHPEQSLGSVARTLALGRRHHDFRRAVVAASRQDGVRALGSGPPGSCGRHDRRVVFLFSGVGDQYPGMGLGLYRACAPFRQQVDQCAALFAAELGFDLRDQMYPEGRWRQVRNEEAPEPAGPEVDLLEMLKRNGSPTAWSTATTHSALFTLEYSMAVVLCHWGLRPGAMIGHSIGEYAAACTAGVMSLPDAVRVVATRARLCDGLPEGAMLAVPLAEREVQPLLRPDLSLAAVNAPNGCVVSGPPSQISVLEEELKASGTVAVRMEANRAFHSGMLKDAAGELERVLRGVELRAPEIPFVSNVTGAWITGEEATSPAYWAGQLCQTVRFSKGLETLLDDSPTALVELGPGATLSAFVESYLRSERRELPPSAQTVSARYRQRPALPFLLEAVGKLWASGCDVDWPAFYEKVQPRAPLTSYPFERERYWISPPNEEGRATDLTAPPESQAARAESGGTSAASRLAPNGDLETALVAIWCHVLGCSKVDVTDDFFELGGHSFLALQLSNEVWRRLRLDLPLNAILANPTIAQLALFLQRAPGQDEASEGRIDLSALDIEARKGQIEGYIRRKLALFRGPARVGENAPSRSEWESLGPDLVGWFRRDFGVRLYPNELERHPDPVALANYIALSLEGRHASPNPSTPPTASIPGVVFLLSSVRSGSTLLRVMLAGHSGLFSPPELHLLPYTDLQQRVRGELSPDRDQGLIRAFSEALGVTNEAAAELVAGFTRANLSTWEVYNRLRQACGDRLLVDKSPGNANQLGSLRRADAYFENPRYVWLVRHPYSVIDSVVRNRFVGLMEAGRLDPHQFGEFLWQRSNANIADFVEGLEPSRVHRLRYEDLVTDPERTTASLCRFLGLDFEPSLVRPYEGRRMRDGLGDPNLSERSTIVAELADEWKRIELPGPLNRATRQLARELGYEVPQGERTAAAAAPAKRSEVATAPVMLNTGGGGHALFLMHPLDGSVFCYVHLARAFGEGRRVYGVQAPAAPDGGGDDVSLEELASSYVSRVQAIQPNGPYFLGGWSMGGVLAYEMARQLRARGHGIGQLTLIDSPAPLEPVTAPEVPESAYLVGLYARLISQRFQVELDVGPDRLEGLGRDEQLELLWEAVVRHPAMASLSKTELSTRLRTVESNYSRVRRYRPHRYEGGATLVRASAPRCFIDRTRAWDHPDGKYGWSTLVTGPLQVTELDADHYTILAPRHARKLAALWSGASDPKASHPRRALDAADQNT